MRLPFVDQMTSGKSIPDDASIGDGEKTQVDTRRVMRIVMCDEMRRMKKVEVENR
jgi:hypothetical protein